MGCRSPPVDGPGLPVPTRLMSTAIHIMSSTVDIQRSSLLMHRPEIWALESAGVATLRNLQGRADPTPAEAAPTNHPKARAIMVYRFREPIPAT